MTVSTDATKTGVIVTAAKVRPILGVIGDSRMASEFTSGGVAPNIVMRNPPNAIVGWAAILSNQRVTFSSAYNKAVGGTLVSDLAGQYAQLLSVSPTCTHVVILSGTNSFAAGVTGLAAWTDMASLLRTIAMSGIRPIVILDLPRTLASWNSTAAANSFYFNQLVRRSAPSLGAIVIDPTKSIADPANANGDPLTGYYYDSVHPATLAAYYVGQELANAVLLTIGDPAMAGFTSRGDIYSANNPYGNAVSGGLFTGTTGTNVSSGGAASGTVATGWTNRTLSGTGTSVASIVARTDGKPGNWQQLVQTSGGGVSSYSLFTALLLNTNYPPLSLVLEADINVTSATGLESFAVTAYNYDGVSTLYEGAQALGTTQIGATYYPMPSSFAGRIRTEPLAYNGVTSQILVRVDTRINTGAATIQVGGLELRAV